MEKNTEDPQPDDRPIDLKPKKRRTTQIWLVVLVVLIAAVLVASTLLTPKALDTNVQILEAGDHLHYEMRTHFNNATYNGSADYYIDSASKEGISYMATSSGWSQIEGLGHDFKPYLAGPSYYGGLVGVREINTSFGVKSVKDLYRFDFGEVVVLSMGMDSSIVYRWTVSSSNGDYWYTYELTESNNTQLTLVDQVMRITSVKGSSNTALTPGPSCTWQYHEPLGGYGVMAGSAEVREGERFHYVAGGNITVLVFDLQDLRDIQDNGVFTYRNSLSRLQGNPGETNTTVSPGTYWYAAIYTGSSAPIPASEVPESLYATDIQVGAYFIGYFDG